MVLDLLSPWRFHSQLAAPVRETGEKVPFTCRWMGYETPAAASDWMKPDYDDRFWHRGPLTLVPKTALLSRACLRGKFTATDPAAVEGLRLSATYNGGIIVYVNGKEIRREHIAVAGQLAEGPGGEERTVDCEVPADVLRKGMNVIAVEIVRTPYPKEGAEPGEDVYNVNCCDIKQVQLKATSAAGLVPNTVRPQGLQVWPAEPLAVDLNLDHGDVAEPLRPATILGGAERSVLGQTGRGLVETDSRAEGHRRRSGRRRRTHSRGRRANPIRSGMGRPAAPGDDAAELPAALHQIQRRAIQRPRARSAGTSGRKAADRGMVSREESARSCDSGTRGDRAGVGDGESAGQRQGGTVSGNRKGRGARAKRRSRPPWRCALRIGNCRIRRTSARGWT